MTDTWLSKNHPEWLFSGPKVGSDLNLLNLGNPDARRWLTNHIDRMLTEQGHRSVSAGLQHGPVAHSGGRTTPRIARASPRSDTLRATWPIGTSCGGVIPTCSSTRAPAAVGGTIWKPSAAPCHCCGATPSSSRVANQCHTYGISSWIPYYGTGSGVIDPYMFRSVMCPHFTACFDMRRKDLNYAEARRLLGQWRQIAPYFLGDYYPLTPYSLDKSAWIGWQFDCPENGGGMIQAFRRGESPYESIRVKLRGLEPGAIYAIMNLDAASAKQIGGEELLEQGISIAIGEKPGAAVIKYHKL